MVESAILLRGTVLRIIQQATRNATLQTFIRFAVTGVPGIVLAFSANFLFVELLHWSKPIAYALVVWIQLTLGFLLCRLFVFAGRSVPIPKAYLSFTIRIGAIRVADWSLYTALVQIVHTPYLLAQSINLLIFPIIKFLSVRSVFSDRDGVRPNRLARRVRSLFTM